MTPEEMKFWIDIFHSPAVIAFAGGIMGASVTLVATWSKNRHDSKESEKAWTREEKRRKEERAFQNKNSAYEEFLGRLEKGPLTHILPSLGKIIMYGNKDTKKQAGLLVDQIAEVEKFSDKNSKEYKKAIEVVHTRLNKLHNAIIEDINKYIDK